MLLRPEAHEFEETEDPSTQASLDKILESDLETYSININDEKPDQDRI